MKGDTFAYSHRGESRAYMVSNICVLSFGEEPLSVCPPNSNTTIAVRQIESDGCGFVLKCIV